MARKPYQSEGYQRARRAVLGRPCVLRLACGGAPATTADHYPPLSKHVHVPGTHCCVLRPACKACQDKQGGTISVKRGRFSRTPPRPPRSSRLW